MLNDKKNPFSKVQPDFRTSPDKIALYKARDTTNAIQPQLCGHIPYVCVCVCVQDHRFMTPSGPCFCDTIVGGTIS